MKNKKFLLLLVSSFIAVTLIFVFFIPFNKKTNGTIIDVIGYDVKNYCQYEGNTIKVDVEKYQKEHAWNRLVLLNTHKDSFEYIIFYKRHASNMLAHFENNYRTYYKNIDTIFIKDNYILKKRIKNFKYQYAERSMRINELFLFELDSLMNQYNKCNVAFLDLFFQRSYKIADKEMILFNNKTIFDVTKEGVRCYYIEY